MATYPSQQNLAPSAQAYPKTPSPASSARLQPGTKVQVGKYVVQVEKFLSEGGFAHVYVASLVSPSSVQGFSPSQNRFVLKRMAVPDKAGLVDVRQEVDVMKQLRPHKHVVYFIEASASSLPGTSGYEIFILMEWCPGGGIIDLLNSRLQNRLTESEILKIFSDTVDAVAHMHGQNPILMHRDLKVENILVASSNLYKLCDFGSTTTPLPRPPQSTAEIQALEADLNKHTTLQYRAPEMVDVWSRKGVTEKADIWALGVFLYKLCYYTTPFEEHGPLAIMNVQYKVPSYPAYSNSIKYLIGTMLQELAQSRPDIWQVHEHTCKLRGIAPYLIRPRRKDSLKGNLTNPSQVANVTATRASNLKTGPNGLGSIFKVPSPPRASLNTTEAVVPMRRGRPPVKAKPTAVAENHRTVSIDAELSASPLNPTSGSPPEESDLFAREAAAGFGDAFLSPTPNLPSALPTVKLGPRAFDDKHAPISSPKRHEPARHSSQAMNMIRQESKDASSAFEDLVPPRKINPIKTMNEIRSGRANVDSASPTGVNSPTLGSNTKSSLTPLKQLGIPQPGQISHSRLGSLSQKTGPGTSSSGSPRLPAYRKISITQRTGPAVTCITPSIVSHPAPSLSDWLKKDQAKLVSRSTQTSPSLIKSLMFELMQSAPLKSPSDKGSPSHRAFDLLTGDNSEMHEFFPPSFNYSATAGINRNSLKANSNDGLKPKPYSILEGGKPPMNLAAGANLPLASGLVSKHSYVGSAHDAHNRHVQGGSSASSSDEEPEDAEGPRRHQGLGLSAKPAGLSQSTKPPLNPTSHQLSEQPSIEASTRSIKPTTPAFEAESGTVTGEFHPELDQSASSSTPANNSEVMTEEDEDLKAKRRAAIAKFAPSGNQFSSNDASEQTERDPFSSRAKSRSASPEARTLTTIMNKPVRRDIGPPLRAPKPQSLKSAAAITNLVSRYENLSAAGSAPISPISPSTPKFLVTTTGKVNQDALNKRQSLTTFKPSAGPNSGYDGAGTSLLNKNAHIPKKSLGPGLSSNQHRTSDSLSTLPKAETEEEESFSGVNDMKSKWETGAVKRAEQKSKAPRTDYGQS